MGKPGNGTKLEPTLLWENHEPGGRVTATSSWGVLSGVVLGGGESPPHGEGPDGSTQPAKETRAGHVGLDQHEPTSLRGIANRAKESKDHRFQNLYQCLNAELLRECWQDLNKDAASGVDGVTAAQYQEHLERIQGPARDGRTIHVLCRFREDANLIIITVYALPEDP